MSVLSECAGKPCVFLLLAKDNFFALISVVLSSVHFFFQSDFLSHCSFSRLIGMSAFKEDFLLKSAGFFDNQWVQLLAS